MKISRPLLSAPCTQYRLHGNRVSRGWGWGVGVIVAFTMSPIHGDQPIAVHIGAAGQLLYSTLDSETGELTAPEVAGRGEATMLARSSDGRLLFATGTLDGASTAANGSVAAYLVDRETGQCSHLGSQSTQGRTACFVSVDASGRHLFVANFRQDDPHSRGSVVRLPISEHGSLEPVAWRVEHRGSGARLPRQAASHPHSVVISPDNQLVAVGDLGIDRTAVYRFDATNGALNRVGEKGFAAAPGAGPRHVAFHPTVQRLYVINENSGQIDVFSTAGQDFGERLQTLQARGGGSADLQVHPSGRWLYGSNRSGNNIMVMAVNPEDGLLSHVALHDSGGDGPRELEITPAGRLLLVSNTGSGELVVFRIDPNSGVLAAVSPGLTIPGLNSVVTFAGYEDR